MKLSLSISTNFRPWEKVTSYQKVTNFTEFGDYDGNYHKENKATANTLSPLELLFSFSEKEIWCDASMHAALQRIWEYMKTIARGRKNLSKTSV